MQFFRNGAIEGVTVLGTDDSRGRPYIVGSLLTKKIAFALQQYLQVLTSFDMGVPVVAFLSFTRMDGCTLRYSSGYGGGYRVSDARPGNDILLPELVIEEPLVNAPQALRPAFDAMWHAFGFLRCDMYDGQGAWVGDR